MSADRAAAAARTSNRPSTDPAGIVLLLAGTALAGLMAVRSESPTARCFQTNTCDGLTFAVVAELLDDGQSPYDATARRTHVSERYLDGDAVPFDLPFQYPPNGLTLFVGRAWPSPRLGHVLWGVGTTLGLLAVLWVFARERIADPLSAFLLLGGVAASGVISFNAQLGQTGALAAAMVVGIAWSWHRAPFVAGALIGVLMFKPQYAIPLGVVAVINSHWRVCLAAAVSLIACCAVSGAAFGFGLWTDFFQAIGEPNHTAPFMVNWMGLLWRVFPGAPFVQAGGVPVVVFVVGVGMLALLLWFVRSRAPLDLQLAATLSVSVVASPNTHPYDLLVLAPLLVQLTGRQHGPLVGPAFALLTWSLLSPPSRWMLAVALLGLAVFSVVLLQRETKGLSAQLHATRRVGLLPR